MPCWCAARPRPLQRLARAAGDLHLNEREPPLEEQGSAEIVAVTRAFNAMRSRIQNYLMDRERLFSAISHDLRTPITRLRLRTELLDDDSVREKFERDLRELEMLVKGALQSVKDTDIHENTEDVDINELLQDLAGPYLEQGDRVRLAGRPAAPTGASPWR